MTPASAPPTLGQLFTAFLRISLLGVGGPSAHLALMLDDVVERRGWIDREHFLHLIGVTHLIPGPNSSQVAMHLGYTQRGVAGLAVTGLAFLGPTFVIVTTLSVVYFRYGSLPAVEPVLWALKPVVVAIILMAAWRLGKVALAGRSGVALGLVGLLVAYVAGRWIVLAMAAAGLATWAAWRRGAGGGAAPESPWEGGGGTAGAPDPGDGPGTRPTRGPGGLSPLVLVLQAPAAAGAVTAPTLLKVFALHLTVGSLLFGGGYTLVALLQPYVVDATGWLTSEAFLDGVALSQAVPGPISTLSAFVGYAAAGLPGAVLATVGVYLPAVLAVVLTAPHVERLRRADWARAALSGVNAVVCGSIFGIALTLLPAAVPDLTRGALLAAALLAMARFRVPAFAIVLGGLAAGLLRMVLT